MRVPLPRRAIAAVAAVAAIGLGAASFPGVATAAASGAAAGSAGRFPALTSGTSSIWAGYAATGGRYTSVSASWTQPAVNCAVTPTGSSSVMVGLDDGATIEQIGVEADCSNGQAGYAAWYELYPLYPTYYANTVAPGDHLTASVTTSGTGSFTLAVSDATRGWTRTANATLKSAPLASAEVVVEGPSGSGLADFGTVSVTGAAANGTLFGSLPGLQRIDMVSGSTVRATTSSVSGGNFSVTWRHS